MEEMRKHISFKYVQQGQDYNKGTKPTEKHVEAVFCDREIDFGKNQFTKSKYDFFNLRNFQIMCPDRSSGTQLFSDNVKEGLSVQTWEFRVDRCVENTKDNNKCESPAKMKEYVRDFEIQQWTIEERLNF